MDNEIYKTMDGEEILFVVSKEKESSKVSEIDVIDCRTDEGITVGLIDSIIFIWTCGMKTPYQF